jgi:hypothetical protein
MLWMGIWVHPYSVALVPGGVGLKKIRVLLSPSEVVWSWLILQTHLECIPHPYHMYTKCVSTLICCGWAYGSALTLLLLFQVRYDFRKIRVLLSLSDILRSWLMLQTHLGCIPHPYHMYKESFSTLICRGYGHMGAPLHCYACAGREWIFGNLG